MAIIVLQTLTESLGSMVINILQTLTESQGSMAIIVLQTLTESLGSMAIIAQLPWNKYVTRHDVMAAQSNIQGCTPVQSTTGAITQDMYHLSRGDT